ncbi:MutS like protein 4 [Astathelohania contejeani]|uniref:MutS like protein 4 n=1 Tax=Astathelohania contejeani TaxID=164912 RepID=A0ABQ7I1N0_9MICR|nr:MutS like protein 4 [Thelohania contejeani]
MNVSEEQNVIACISLSRSQTPIIGVSIYHQSKIHTVEFLDSWQLSILYQQLLIYKPYTIIIPEDQTNLQKMLNTKLSDVTIIMISRKEYETESIKIDNPINLEKHYFGFISATALTGYLEYNGISKIQSIEFIELENRLFLSEQTIRDLEIIDGSGGKSLFSMVKNNKTKMGERLLKANLLQPFTDIEIIQARHNKLKVLIDNQSQCIKLEKILKNISDIDSMIEYIIRSKKCTLRDLTNNIINCIKIKCLFVSLTSLKECINEIVTDNEFPKNIIISIDKLQPLFSKISKYINPEANYTPTNCIDQIIQSIKQNENDSLEIAKQIYYENIEDLNHIFLKIKSMMNINVELIHDPIKGYLIKCKEDILFSNTEASNQDCINNKFDETKYNKLIFVSKKRNYFLFTNIELQKINSRIFDSYNQIIEIAGVICHDLHLEIEEHVIDLQELCSLIGELDIILGYNLFSKKFQCCLPEFSDGILITDSHHFFIKKEKSIPNSFYACPKLNFNIVTGSNMSGKTSYVKQLAHTIILAQIGSPVYASYASLKIFKNIYTKLNNNSDFNFSTFETELNDSLNIINKATSDSLVLIDESGRGTSYIDGLSFAYTLAYYLIDKNIFTYFITHFSRLIDLLKENERVNVLKNRHHKVTSGLNIQEMGIEISSQYLPRDVINDAISIKKLINKECFDSKGFDNSEIQLAIKIEKSTPEEKEKLRKDVITPSNK